MIIKTILIEKSLFELNCSMKTSKAQINKILKLFKWKILLCIYINTK